MVDAKLSSYQVTRDGNPIESCGIDATNYENPVSAEQDRGRSILRELGAVIIIPRDPLLAGQYSVSATINNHPYQWSFTVAPKSTTAMNLPSKLPGKDKLEAALRGAEAIAKKADSEGRAEYARTVATANAARATAAAKLREFQRRRGSAFLEGPGPVSAADAGQWLAELNRDRAAVGLTPVAEDPALSDGDLKHAKYVAINYPIQAALGAELHSEDPSKPGYTPEGKTAAGQSNVAPYWYPPLFRCPIDTVGGLSECMAGRAFPSRVDTVSGAAPCRLRPVLPGPRVRRRAGCLRIASRQSRSDRVRATGLFSSAKVSDRFS